MPPKPKDLGLSYEAAMHGVQSGVKLLMQQPNDKGTDLKHLRVGVNSALLDSGALAYHLITKGLITEEEYLETIRLFANNELAKYEAEVAKLYPLGAKIKLR